MAVNILLKRSATASKRPVGASMAFGELNLNYDAATGGLYYKDSSGGVVKVGPCQVSATAPNVSPAGSTGNSAGEFWYDTANLTLKVYTGSAWVNAAAASTSTLVSATAPITVDNTDPLNPIVGIDAASTSAAGAVQLNNTTNSTSTTQAATANSVKLTYDLANDALPKSGGTMTGDILFNAGQSFPGTVTSVSAAGGSAISVDNTDPAQPVLSVAAASTTSPGVVQLNDSTTSTSTTEALTAAQGKVLQDQIDALVISTNLTLAGTFDASTGLVDSVTTAGTSAGFTVGSALPAPSAGNADYFVIVDVQGSSGPSGTPPYHIGDWFLSDGSSWQFLNVGFQAPYATTTTAGVVQLATDAEVQAGVNTDHAVTSSGLQSKVSDSVSTTSSTTIASSTAAKAAYDAGIQGQTDAAAAQATADDALPKAGGTMTGDITFSGEAGVIFDDGSSVYGISSAVDSNAINIAASSAAVKTAYDLAAGALPSSGGSMTGNLYITNSELQVDSSSTFNSVGTATFTGTTDLNGNTSFFFTPTWLENIGPASQVTYDNATSGLSAVNVQAAIDELAAGVDGVQGITSTAPVTVDNTDPANPIIGIDAASTTAAGAVQLNDTVTSTSTTEAATANAVKTAYDAATAAALWTETAGVLSPSTANNVVTIDVPMGIDGVTVTDSALSISTLLSPAQAIFLDNVQSVTVSGSSSVITHVVDSVLGTIPGILSVDEAANPAPYNLQIGELQLNGDAGTSGYVLQSNGPGSAPTWVANSPDGVQGVTGTAPITVDNTDPANPVVSISAASTTAAGAVQLNDTVSSTSTTLAATANAVKTAYDAAITAQGQSPLTSATVLYVNVTSGNDSTGARGTAKPFATITAALAAASNGDTIFVAPGTYVESPTLSKGVSLIGTFVDQSISSGPKISGTFTVSITGPTQRNWAVANFQFQASSVGNNSVVVSNNSFGSGGLGSFTNCFFQQFTSASLTEQCFATSGTWTRSLYLRNCTFDGNFTHNAGTTAGASGYIVIDNLLGIAGNDKYYKIASGTCEIRNPSNALAPVLHTGGTFIASNVLSWISNIAATTTIFGGTGFAYKGTSAGLGQATVSFAGQGVNVVEGSTWGKISVGTNVIYAFGNVIYDTSLATLSGLPLTAVAPNPNGVLSTMARPQWGYLTTPSSVTAANQLGVILDSTNGNVYTTSAFDAGTY